LLLLSLLRSFESSFVIMVNLGDVGHTFFRRLNWRTVAALIVSVLLLEVLYQSYETSHGSMISANDVLTKAKSTSGKPASQAKGATGIIDATKDVEVIAPGSVATLPDGRVPYPPLPPADESEYLAICMLVRNQSLDLPEMLQHHYHHMGVRRFIIFDDGTIPPLSSHDYGIPKETITWQYIDTRPFWAYIQYYAYDECAKRFGKNHTWLGFLDADEFLEMTDKSVSLVEFLKEWELRDDVGAVGANWQLHTSAGVLERPKSSREVFDTCVHDSGPEYLEDNRHIKSFVKAKYYASTSTPHNFNLHNGKKTVGENGDKVDFAWRTPITRDRWGVHHYALKSKQEWTEKMARGGGSLSHKNWTFWDNLHKFPQTPCANLTKYIP
jgi:Glycosyltransferase family 92